MHPGAGTTPIVRAEIVSLVADGTPVATVAERLRISRQTVYKWLRRYRLSGSPGLEDRRSTPHRSPGRTEARLEALVAQLRRDRRLFAWQIALGLGIARSTVIRILARLGLNRLTRIDLPRIFQRYEFAEAGQLVHIDIKKLARINRIGHRIHGNHRMRKRGAGWEYVYVCVDDSTRLAFLEVREREDRFEATAFLQQAAQWFARRNIGFERVMTDNGKVFLSKAFAAELEALGARHLRTPIYTPRVNGKAERFIRTMLGECAYGMVFENSYQRRAALAAWNRFYNEERPHTALNYGPPASRLTSVNNLRSLYS
jgi:transposase InsO family protein